MVHGQWRGQCQHRGKWGMGLMGNGAHGQWGTGTSRVQGVLGTWVMGHRGNGCTGGMGYRS